MSICRAHIGPMMDLSNHVTNYLSGVIVIVVVILKLGAVA